MQLTPYQEDCLKEVINIGIGRAAASISELINIRVELTVPHVSLCMLEELGPAMVNNLTESFLLITQDFDGEVAGRAALVFPQESGLCLARLLSGNDSGQDELDLELRGILIEVANIVLNSVMGSIANVLRVVLDFSLPMFSGSHRDPDLAQMLALRFHSLAQVVVLADATFCVRDMPLTSKLLLLFQFGGIEVILNKLTQEDHRS